ncbi:RNA-directed DNA polymerase from mobile element jockey [Trichonephila clavipes]|nr:RNA-directed DNA polymerase from mobile element jockey [Trichonephila clavipes]
MYIADSRQRILKKIFNSGSNCIIAGDFNATHVDWHNAKNTRYGVMLRNLVRNLRGVILVAPQTATHLQPRQRSGSVIDLAVFKHIPYNHSIRVLSDLSSDHYPLAISELNQNFSEAFVEASKPKFKNVPKILSPKIKSKIHQRNRLRKFWQRTRCPSIYSEFRTLSREIAKVIKSHSQAEWEKHIEALSPEDNTLWRKSSLLRKPFLSIPPLKGALGSTAITPIEKAEVIADSLQEQFEPNHVADREEFDQRIDEEVTNFLAIPHIQEIEPTTPTEVLTYVQRSKPKKSPRLDQITNRMIKNLPLKFLLFITLLINQLFKNNYFPDSWKTAVVIPILKPDKNPELAQNYRPMSLLSCLSKVYEFVLLHRLNQHCTASNFIIPQQCGFRPKCSTVHQLLRVTELIHSGFAKHDATGILFLDIAKAFDKIWHDGLLIKLIRLDFPAPLIKSIHSFLSHRSFRVRVDRILSSPRPIRSGLPQGSLSSPLFFTLYVNDIPQTDSSHLAMFADDTAVISQNKRFSVVISNLQHYISLLELRLNDWKIKVNASKSACLMFTRRSQLPVGLIPVTIFGQPVPWVNVARYLGLFLDAKLTFAYHIEQTRKKALAVHAMLKRLISRRSKLPIRHKVLLYKSIIRPVMCYGSQIFGSAGMCHLKKLHTLTNSFLRQLVNAPWFVRNEVIYIIPSSAPRVVDLKYLPKQCSLRSESQRFGSVIDLAVFKQIPYNHSIRVLSDLSSDHYPVILEINLNTSLIKNPEQFSTNWSNFKFALNKKPLPTTDLTSNENIELAISELNQNFSEAFVEASKPKFKNVPKILSPEIKSKIHQRNRLRKFWQRTRCPSIYSEFRTLSREIAKDIKSHSQAQWEKHIEALSPENNTLWRKSSLLRKPFHSIPPLKGALGSTAITPIEKAEVIADSLQEQFEPNHVADREEFDQRIHEEVANFLATPHVQDIEPTTPTEV